MQVKVVLVVVVVVSNCRLWKLVEVELVNEPRGWLGMPGLALAGHMPGTACRHGSDCTRAMLLGPMARDGTTMQCRAGVAECANGS